MDNADKKLLAALQENGRMANVQLAELLDLSESPTFRRVKRLELNGTITGYAAIVNQRRLGLDVTAYVQVSMDKQPDKAQHEFHGCVLAEPHIIECHAMSGSYDFLMKVVARNIDHFADLCMNEILTYPGVHHIESAFSLKEIKNARVLPVI